MSKKKTITVAEYAAARGVSKQAVYQQLNKRLKPFVQVVDGKKCLDVAALDAIEDSTVEQVEKENSTKVEQAVEQVEQAHLLSILETQLVVKDEQISVLQDELTAARRQIDELNATMREQSEKILTLLANSQELQRADRVLMAGTLTQDTPQEKKGFWQRLFKR